MLPPGMCGWVGLATVGCAAGLECRSWINGGFWSTSMAMVHELG